MVISDLQNQVKYLLVQQMQFHVLDLSLVNVIVDISSLLEFVFHVLMEEILKLVHQLLMH